MERMIKASSKAGDSVLDPFLGSGTTCHVAQILERQWIGIDINPEYIEMSSKRLEQPFDGSFDSIDPRASRTPENLPTRKPVAQPSLWLDES